MSFYGILGRWSGVPQLAFLPLLGLTVWCLLWLPLVVVRLNAEGRVLGSEGRMSGSCMPRKTSRLKVYVDTYYV